MQVLKRAQLEETVPIRRVRRTIDRDLATIVMTALARDPGARYATVRDLRNDLARWLEGDEVTGRRSALVRLWHRVRSRVAAALGLVLALLMLVSSITYNVQLTTMREADRERMDQLDRDTRAMQTSLVEARLEVATLLVQSDRAAEANALLTDMLRQASAGGFGGRIPRAALQGASHARRRGGGHARPPRRRHPRRDRGRVGLALSSRTSMRVAVLALDLTTPVPGRGQEVWDRRGSIRTSTGPRRSACSRARSGTRSRWCA